MTTRLSVHHVTSITAKAESYPPATVLILSARDGDGAEFEISFYCRDINPTARVAQAATAINDLLGPRQERA